MPYSSVKDVPDNIPSEHKKQWLEVWNSVYSNNTKAGKSKQDAETAAFTQANGVIKKESVSLTQADSSHWEGVHMFYKTKEVGKTISADNAKKIQNIHDTVGELGANCGGPVGMGGIYESSRNLEAALAHTDSHSALHGHMHRALKAHLGLGTGWSEDSPYIHDIFPEHIVYGQKGTTYAQKYTVKHGAAGSDPTIKFSGDRKKVHTAYVESKDQATESMSLFSIAPEGMIEDRASFLKLRERGSVSLTQNEDGEQVTETGVAMLDAALVKEAASGNKLLHIPIKIIAPGWGSMGYYPQDVLQRDGSTAFPAGTQMFWNHNTESEDMQRPEGDLARLAAVTTKEASWMDNGPKGPGLYAQAKVFSDYADQVSEKGSNIGLSINTFVKGKEGEMDGRRGRIVEKLIGSRFTTVDFVTKAGAGGAPIVPARESARSQDNVRKETAMTDQEAKALQDRNALLEIDNAKLREGQNRVLAVGTVATLLREASIPFSQKVLERLCEHPVMIEEKLDPKWVKETVDALSEDETIISGMGDVHREGARTRITPEQEKEETERFKEAMRELSVPEAGLAVALGGK